MVCLTLLRQTILYVSIICFELRKALEKQHQQNQQDDKSHFLYIVTGLPSKNNNQKLYQLLTLKTFCYARI
jgi:hypothetical protein